MNHAFKNGVDDLIRLTNDDVNANYESEVTCHGALFSPSTGILDSHSFMISLLADVEMYGSTLALNSDVEDISVVDGNNSDNKRGGNIKLTAEGMELICDSVVNCAGLHAGSIAQMLFDSVLKKQSGTCAIDPNNTKNMHDHHDNNHHQQYYAKGNYYRLQNQKRPFSHLVYPIPEEGGLGVHATIDLGGNVRFGPDVEWIDKDIINPDEINYSVDIDRVESFYDEVRKYWPNLHDGALAPDYSGIRPKLGHPSNRTGPSTNADFRIEGPSCHGIKGFVNLSGIESPGLTASMAIADDVVKILKETASIGMD
mmetsp:Transcript_1440/g.1572  ORF Transcript_1440/g.1572 Transcript_1440/m.1572 type:complete len:312 (+) Transcript_1440:227-1162(+)